MSNKPPHHEQVYYPTRPAKRVERKMMVEVFRRLTMFGPVKDYRYVGFGSIYFTDFILFHKALSISQMISIEWEKRKAVQERFHFNLPFAGIDLRFAKASEALSGSDFSWDHRTILWLDFTSQLNDEVYECISQFCINAVSGSVLLVTVNANQYMPPDCEDCCVECDKEVLTVSEYLEQKFGDAVPLGMKNEEIAARWGMATVYRKMIANRVSEEVSKRKILHRQLLHFRYRDSSQMLTVGFLLYDEEHKGVVESSAFDDLLFISDPSNPDAAFEIDLPNLTTREVLHMNAQFLQDTAPVKSPGLLAKHIKSYSKIYRYYPMFAEAEFD